MAYTKQQLKDAFCRAKGWEESSNLSQDEFLLQSREQIQDKLDSERNRLQTILNRLPENAIERMKRIAMAQLTKEEAEKIRQENLKVNLL